MSVPRLSSLCSLTLLLIQLTWLEKSIWLASENSGLLITSTSQSTIFTEWLCLYCIKLEPKYTKNEIGELKAEEVPFDCAKVTKVKKFSSDFYLEIIYVLWNFVTKFLENNNKTKMTLICN